MVLQVIAASTLTFLGVVFSITLVALQLASQQFSPRVTRTYARSTTTKVTLGIFIATFVFALVTLAAQESGGGEGGSAPVAALSVALVLVGASVVAFIVFASSTIRLIRIPHIIGAVADETRGAIDENYPPEDRYVAIESRPPDDPRGVIRIDAAPHLLARSRRGVILGFDVSRLVTLAVGRDCHLTAIPQPGEYLSAGSPVVEVRGGESPRAWKVLRAISVGRERTLYQDPAYGIRQLADIATQALSPAVNAPTTAVQVIDRLGDLLLRIAERPDPTGLYVDREHRPRVQVPPVTLWPRIVPLALTEIRTFGARSPQVTRRLMATLDDLLATVPAPRRPELERERALLVAAVEALLPEASARERALTPDRLGLG